MENNTQTSRGYGSPRRAKGKQRPQFGFKELVSGRDPTVDIVAIHGIDGDREDSWTAENGVFWMRDLLPSKIPNARILTYGYDANTHNQEQLATDFMHEHAITFISKLVLLREATSTAERPIVFVAHSFGGLLLKSALIHSHLCNDSHLKNHRAISQSTHGIAFFGTPHQGSATAELARSILDTGSLSTPTSNVLLQHLERDSEALQQQLVQYSAISGQFETKFFYETYGTHVAGSGVSRRVVPRTSAVVPGAVNADAIGVHKDHINMVKFPSADDDDFRTVSTALSLMSKAAYQKKIEKEDRYKSTVNEIALTTSQQNALSNLVRVNAARFNADPRPCCLEGTRVDLLKTITNWIEPGVVCRIFWLCGQVGTGKTTISLTVASNCQTRGRLGASFFFSRDHAERSNLQLVFPTLAQQLGIFHRPFQVLLAKALEQDPDLVQMEPGYQFKRLIVELVKSCDSFPAYAVVILDALDECKDENPISRMLSILSSHIHELPHLKFFITSRPEDQIRVGFNTLSAITQTVILHNINSSVVDADIEHYFRRRFSTTTLLYPDLVKTDWPSAEQIEFLVKKSAGLFIFAATAVKFILDSNYSDPPNQLSVVLGQSPAVAPPSSPLAFLDQLYLQVLRQAFPSGPTPLHRLNLLRSILGAIILLRDPLSPGALETFLSLEPGTVKTTLRRLHSVIVVPATVEQPIRLIHPSFFDFATSRCLDVNFRIDSLGSHRQLAIACFKQMKGLQRNICSIRDASKLNSEIGDLAKRIERCISPAMGYACRHWSFHLCIAGGNTLQGMLRDFCHENILYWIEALSLLGYLREGIRQLQDVSKQLQDVSKFHSRFSVPYEDLLAALDDSTRFMADHFELLSFASLQLYRTALPLSSPSSFLRKTFHHELDGGMRFLRGEWMQKSSSMTILRGSKGDVTSVDFSPNGRLTVSTSGNEVRLWDLGTGTLLRELKAESDSKLIWARFFSEGSRVIAGTSKLTILIWDIATGACVHTTRLGGANLGWSLVLGWRALNCYTMSPDFSLIVGSGNNNIHIWRISDGDLLHTLAGHSGTVKSIEFSPDYMLIASASADSTIRIWDAINGAALRTLRGHFFQVLTIAFSPDIYIVSGSSDNDIRLWGASSGSASLKTLQGHTNSVCSVAFSPDGALVISGSNDHTLRVWDATGGILLQTIRCSAAVKAVGFSPDGTHFIASGGDAIYIWNVDQISNFNQSKEYHFQEVNFSPDGTLIAGKTGNHYHVWDGLTGTNLITDLVSYFPVTFSPNNKYLVSSPSGSEFYLWDVTSWTILQEMRSSDSIFTSFSSDSTRIISTSGDRLQIWDVATGENLFTIDGLYFSSSASFSHDGRQIITKVGRYDIPLHARPHLMDAPLRQLEQLRYCVEGEWIFASRGSKKERRVWIPSDWRRAEYSSSHGRVAIGSYCGLVLLDLSGIRLAI